MQSHSATYRIGYGYIVIALFLPASLPALGEQITLDAIKDNMLIEDSTGSLSNGAGDFFFAGHTGQFDNGIRRGLIAFDLARNIPENAIIEEVSLDLFVTRSAGSSARDVSLHRVLNDWGEGDSDASRGEGSGAPAAPGDATWLHRFHDTDPWLTPGGDFSTLISATQSVPGTAGAVSWSSPELANDVQVFLSNPQENFGWILIGDESTLRTAFQFASRTNPNASRRPTLTIDFTLPTIDDPDANGDGNVDGFDFAIWQSNFGRTGDLSPADGDFDHDGDVDSDDLAVWQSGFGIKIGGPGALNNFSSIPEPTTATLLLPLAIATLRRRKG